MISLCGNYHVKVPCWGYTLKACKTYYLQPRVQRKESLESAIEINVNSLKDDKGDLTCLKQDPSDTHYLQQTVGKTRVTREGGAWQLEWELTLDLLISYQGNPSRGHPHPIPLISTVESF